MALCNSPWCSEELCIWAFAQGKKVAAGKQSMQHESRYLQLNPIWQTSCSQFQSWRNEQEISPPSTLAPRTFCFDPVQQRAKSSQKLRNKKEQLSSNPWNRQPKQTLRNISKGASKIVSTSLALSFGLNACLSESIPTTGTTLRRCCKIV